MVKPRAIVLSGYGLNCEDETSFAFKAAGARADIVHINDLVAAPRTLFRYQILAIPGGFSYGDDTGSGKAYANKLRNHLLDELQKFLARDTLMIGICNGCQILTQSGILPGTFTFNESARYIDRWVDLKVEGESPWLRGIRNLMIPIAHGEGRFYADVSTLAVIERENAVAMRYVRGEVSLLQDLPANSTGTLKDIAGVLGKDGRVLGLMPHPERAMFFTQLPHWQYLKERYTRKGRKLPAWGPGIKVFRNAVRYFL